MTLVGTVWVPVGPSPISSRGVACNGTTTAIAVSPNDPDVIYQGTAGGGVWYTDDRGCTWRPLFDRQVALGIGEPAGIAIDPHDTRTIYVGTSARLTAQTQAGLFKSTDGGASCVRLGSGYPADNVGNASQFIHQWINVIIVDPVDRHTIYLGSSLPPPPPPPPPGVQSGVFRSVDGGLNWTLGANGAGSARSLVLDTSSPPDARVLYAGVSRRGVLKSTDGGQTWTPVLTAATPAVAAVLGSTGAFSRVVVALAPPAPTPDPRGVQVLYATMTGEGKGVPDPVGLFVSTDQGVTWKRKAAKKMPKNTLLGYCLIMGVDPASPGDGTNDTLYVGCVDQAKSTDSGAHFSDELERMHKDTHAWAFFPRRAAATIVYCGNDGGIFRLDEQDEGVSLNAGGLQTSLFYNIDIKPDATADVTVGALLDNQTETTCGGVGLGWTGTNGGDGWDVAYDGQIARRVYTSSGYWNSPHPSTRVFRSDDDGMTWGVGGITPWRDRTSDTKDGPALIATDPALPGLIYVGGSDNLWQSPDGGYTWRIIKRFASRANIDVARGDCNHVVIAVARPRDQDPNVEVGVFVSTNARAATGVTFTDITRNLPSRNVLRAAFDPNDSTVIYAVLGGFDDDGPGETGHVFRTTIAGTAWMDISPPLNVPHGALALDGADIPTTIYVGTDLGVLRSRDGGKSWMVLDDIHFPRALVTDLVLNPEAGVLRAATFGRGVFEFGEPDGPAIAVNLEDGLDFGTCCGGPRFLTLRVFNVGKGDLRIDSVQPIFGAPVCLVLPSPGTPVVLGPDQAVDFTVQFKPSAPGHYKTTIRISSDDPGAPHVDLEARGILGTGTLELVYADGAEFGSVRLGSFADHLLTVNNNGPCTLTISGASSSSEEFIVPGVDHYPLLVSSGCSIDLPIRFKPTSIGPKSATISVTSNDPASHASVEVSGAAPSGAILVTGSTHFCGIELGCCAYQTVSMCNSGHGDLHVSRVALEGQSEHFCLVNNPFPTIVQPGSCIGVVVEFKPTCARIEGCTLVVETDDPHTPRTTLSLTGQLRRTFSSTIRCWLRRLR